MISLCLTAELGPGSSLALRLQLGLTLLVLWVFVTLYSNCIIVFLLSLACKANHLTFQPVLSPPAPPPARSISLENLNQISWSRRWYYCLSESGRQIIQLERLILNPLRSHGVCLVKFSCLGPVIPYFFLIFHGTGNVDPMLIPLLYFQST